MMVKDWEMDVNFRSDRQIISPQMENELTGVEMITLLPP